MRSILSALALAVLAALGAVPATASTESPSAIEFIIQQAALAAHSKAVEPHKRRKGGVVAPSSISAAHGGGMAMRASFYGGGPKKFEPNAHTANGERFNQWGPTCAHRTLPFGTRLQVTFQGSAVCRVNDRGPALWTGRSLDVSRGIAHKIGLVSPGSGIVRVVRLD